MRQSLRWWPTPIRRGGFLPVVPAPDPDPGTERHPSHPSSRLAPTQLQLGWAGVLLHCMYQPAAPHPVSIDSYRAMPCRRVIVWTQGIQGQGTGRKKQTTNKGKHSRSDTRAKSKSVPSLGAHIGRRQAKVTMACRVLTVHAVRCCAAAASQVAHPHLRCESTLTRVESSAGQLASSSKVSAEIRPRSCVPPFLRFLPDTAAPGSLERDLLVDPTRGLGPFRWSPDRPLS
ncbi:hypothetical protein B0J15DRAFT_467463 [Fusarium solani]|uniref:Uncharacterized protein n=1 Tax=Fusarium solani TaxID=169388 RepID=A0A9P9H3N7_FUSSL|nr:uncharacterized protein B0J15DRAFT_467463 [Fusarium solani]KAH7250594.1 hypothetical protein B0J15DRAFT_467463 [Fusarium solani]